MERLTISQIAEKQITQERLNLDQLQEQKNYRDADVKNARAENAVIHTFMEPLWAKEERDTAGPAHLRQRIEAKPTDQGGIQ